MRRRIDASRRPPVSGLLSLACAVNKWGREGNHSVTKPFSLAFKQKMVARLTGKDAVSARQLAFETGLRQQTLSRWLQEASRLPPMPAKRPRRDWSIEEKVRILAKASSLTGTELTAFLQHERVLLAEYEQWRLALGEGGRAPLATTKRISVGGSAKIR